jgi:hypothetical protein
VICSLSASESMNSAPACLMEEGSFYMRLPRHLAETLITSCSLKKTMGSMDGRPPPA